MGFNEFLKLYRDKSGRGLRVQPPNYWEEAYYVYGLGRDERFRMDEEKASRIRRLDGVELLEWTWEPEIENGSLLVRYKGDIYECDLAVPHFAAGTVGYKETQVLGGDETAALRRSTAAFGIRADIRKNPLAAFHLQIKLLCILVPDLFAMLVESSERLFSGRWVRLAAQSVTTPMPEDLYSLQVGSRDNEDIWFFTRGLAPLGLSELEILNGHQRFGFGAMELIRNFASREIAALCRHEDGERDLEEERDISDDDLPPEKDGVLELGQFSDRSPILVKKVIWTEGIKEYDELVNGLGPDRGEGHDTLTSILFLYRTEEDRRRNILTKPRDMADLLDDSRNSYRFLTSMWVTCLRRHLALERLGSLRRGLEICREFIFGGHVMADVEFDLPTGTGDLKDKEYIWMEVEDFAGNEISGRLRERSYFLPELHTGSFVTVPVERLMDWTIYVNGRKITPGSAYVLDLLDE